VEEILCSDLVDDLDSLIHKCQFPSDALFLAESLPQHVVVGAKARRDLLRFAQFDVKIPFATYSSGRIFHRDFELRWEKNNGKFKVVYLGIERELPELEKSGLQLKKLEPLKYYVLFGKRLSEKELELIGIPVNERDFAFAELRIPRLLHYPVKEDNRKRVRLAVREYVEEKADIKEPSDKEPITGPVILFRFQGLETME
jgi:hypothetical protein